MITQMTSRNYDILTIKKLYSLSGNQCAFPECKQELITTDKKINVSDICHIEGGEQNSPRYNSGLDLEQLNDYENLILMCKTHHKIIDTDVSKYTVETLKKIKQAHEQRNKSKEFSISDESAQEIIEEQMNQINVHVGSGSQNVTQTGDIHIQYGITSFYEAKELIQDLFHENFPILKEEAQKVAQESIQEYTAIFLEKANSKLRESDIGKFSEPDMQFVLTRSILQAARKNEPELHENLANLMIERIKNSDDDLRRIVYNEAIETIGKLTKDGLKIITLCFILRYAVWGTVSNYENLDEIIRSSISTLFDFKNTLAEFQHIVYTGCGQLNAERWTYENIIQVQYPELAPILIPKIQVQNNAFPEAVISELFSEVNDENYKFNVTDQATLESYLSKISIPEIMKNTIRTQFKHYTNESLESISTTIPEFEMIQKAASFVSGTILGELSLTSVGMVVGAMYYERLTEEKIDISIWIN